MTYHGQSMPPEDAIAAALFDTFIGTYCEVGAFNGVDLSNTKLFYDWDWKGINFEPNPANYAQLCITQPTAINLCCAVGERCVDSVELWTCPDKPIVTAIQPPDWYVQSDAGGWQNMTKIQVPMLTLTAALTIHGIRALDLLSVDTDGTELEVLRGLDFTQWQPRLIITEYTAGLAPIAAHLAKYGYRQAYTSAINSFFVRTERDVQRIAHAVSSAAHHS